MNASKPLRRLGGLLLAGLLLAACADPDPDGGPAQGGSTTTVPATRPGPTTGPARPSGKVTVTGTVRAGVEPGCLLLESDRGRPYLLVGGDRARLGPGARVTVTGRVVPDLLSICQQGEPLVVAAIEAAP
jgi:hypothetical protein